MLNKAASPQAGARALRNPLGEFGPERAEHAALTLRVVTSLDELGRLRAEYEQLQAVTSHGLPFSRHEWHIAWCHHFLHSATRVPALLSVYFFYNTDGTCVAIVPLIMTRRSFGPFRAVALDMLGPDPALTEVRAPMVAPGYEGRVAECLQQCLAEDRDWDWINWSGVGARFGQALEKCALLQWQDPLMAYVLDLPATWEEFRAGLKRNIRESLRHCYNSLQRDGIEFTFRIAREPSEVREAIDRFLVLHAMRAGQTGGVSHENFFGSPRVRAFLYDVCARLGEQDAVRVFQLVIGGEVVATRVGFVVGAHLFLYYSGFDPRWGKYSVMTTTIAEAMKYAIGEGLLTVNLSTGTDPGKTRWGPRPVSYGRAFQVAPSLKSRVVHALYRRARSPAGLPWWLRLVARRQQRDWF